MPDAATQHGRPKLLITLPALRIPSMVMVGRVLSWRVTLAAADMMTAAGLVAGALLGLLS